MSEVFVLTCLGPSISPEILTHITSRLSVHRIETLESKTLAAKNPACIETSITSNLGIDPDLLTRELLQLTTPFGVDIIIQKNDPCRHKKGLLVMDVDSTLIQVEVIDELAKEAGIGNKVASITSRAMNGELSFKESLLERVHLLKGLPIGILSDIYERIPFTSGARVMLSILKKRGLRTGVLSGGFDYFTSRLKESLRLDYAYSNRLETKKGVLTGEVIGEIVDGEKKAALMEEIALKEGIPLNQVIAIGDGANDLPMIKRAGLGIAFNAKPSVRASARYSITQASLLSVLYVLGISDEEIQSSRHKDSF